MSKVLNNFQTETIRGHPKEIPRFHVLLDVGFGAVPSELGLGRSDGAIIKQNQHHFPTMGLILDIAQAGR